MSQLQDLLQALPQALEQNAAQPASASDLLTEGGAGIQFSFEQESWDKVIEFLADEAQLTLIHDVGWPPGTFTYTHDRSFYTVTQAIDLVNGILQTKNYTLVRKGKTLTLVNFTDPIPQSLVPDVDRRELDKYGEFELVRVVFPLQRMTAEQAAAEVQGLLGPMGEVVTLPQTPPSACGKWRGDFETPSSR